MLKERKFGVGVYLAGLLAVLASPVWAGSAIVDTLSDVLDGDVSSLTALAATPGADGKVSLREAITASNNTSGGDQITFSVNGVIEVLSELPALSDASGGVAILGGGLIVLKNSSGLTTVDGLVVTSAANDLRGLTIRGFASGVHIKGASATINIVSECTIGGVRTGELLEDANSIGITIGEGASQNFIGMSVSGSGNVLSNNALHGLLIDGGAFDNTVRRNFIGTTADGEAAAPNELNGIVINNGHGNMIGGASDADGNLISGNRQNGVMILNLSSQNQLHSNIIGLNLNEDGAIPNATGILIGSSATANSIGQVSLARGNTISGNTGAGISIQNAADNLVLGNVIGGFYEGDGLGNGGDGVSISGISEGNRIGDATFSGVNYINFNGGNGVLMDGVDTRTNGVNQCELFGNGDLAIRILNGAQDGITPPTLDPVQPGQPVFGVAPALGEVEIYELDEFGLYFLERVTVGVKGSFQTSSPIVRTETSQIVATLTDENQNTSEFSAPQVVALTLNATPVQLINIFMGFDSNLDELLNLAEYQAGTGRDSASFTAADTNADGALTYDELLAAALVEASFDPVTVTTLSDVADAPDTSSIASLLLDPGADSQVSLREVLASSQFDSNLHITFSVSGTIQPGSELPAIGSVASRFVIDGKGAIVLDGSLLSNNENGLVLSGISNQILGLQIVNFPGAGIKITGENAFSNHVLRCKIGTDGVAALGNGTGILIDSSAEGSSVGGGLATLRNIISGNLVGIAVDGSNTIYTTIAGNYIGVGADGATAIANTKNGIVFSNSTSFNFVLSAGPYHLPNVISGNGDGTSGGGITITGTSNRNFILGAKIGLSADGTSTVGNNPHGILIESSANSNFIGLDGDEIAGKSARGAFAAASVGLPNKGILTEDFLAPNTIVGNTQDGVRVDGDTTSGNTIFYNSIHDNGGMAINLLNGANGGIDPPVITRASTTLVTGIGAPSGLVQLFSDLSDEAEFYVALAACDSEGNWSVDTDKINKSVVFHTATITDALGNTSALSEPVEISDSPICDDPEADQDGDGATDCVETNLGTDPQSPDTDGDGMPDGFEIEFSLNPLSVDDATLDNDHDFLSNLEEYLGGTNPNVADNVDITLHVDSEIGVDGPDNGAADNPLRTIGAAMTRAAGAPGTVKFVRLAAGEYPEDVTFAAGVTLSGPVDDPEVEGDTAIITGVIAGAAGAVLEDVTVLAQNGTETLVNMDSADMIVRRVQFIGLGDNRAGTGVLAQGAASASGLVDDCDFVDLGIGVEITGGLPVVRKSLFQDPGVAGIVIRETADVSGDEGLSTSLDSGSGFNTFAFDPAAENPVAEPAAVINETDVELRMENNDWGTNDDAAVTALISGPADFSPKLAAGSAILASTVICTIFDDTTQARVTNASAALEVSGFRPVTNNDNGVYAFPAVLEGGYQIVGAATGFNENSVAFNVGAAEIKSVVLPLSAVNGGEGEGEGEGEKDPGRPASCGPGGSEGALWGDLALVVLLVSLLALGFGRADAEGGARRS